MGSSRIVARLSSRLQPFALKLNSQNASVLSNNSSMLKSASQSAINRRLSLISRLPVELSSLETMMPLHSAIASARLQSSLSLESQAWGLVPQAIKTASLSLSRLGATDRVSNVAEDSITCTRKS
ncbi:UNVERIFIED_CONTAM: hypothetical protein Sradi_3853600, partial [Sesamum radiatum]